MEGDKFRTEKNEREQVWVRRAARLYLTPAEWQREFGKENFSDPVLDSDEVESLREMINQVDRYRRADRPFNDLFEHGLELLAEHGSKIWHSPISRVSVYSQAEPFCWIGSGSKRNLVIDVSDEPRGMMCLSMHRQKTVDYTDETTWQPVLHNINGYKRWR